MRNRGGNQVADFLSSFNQTYGLTNKIAESIDMANVAKEQPQQTVGFTPEQGKDLEASAARGDTVNYDDANKSYVVSPQMPDGQAGPAQPRAIAQGGVTDFMGQRTAGTMSDDQLMTARMKAMAGVKAKYDPEAGLRMMREVKQDTRDDQRFTWDTNRNEREMKQGAEQDADRETMRKVDTDVGDWFKQRLSQPDGTQRAATVDDHLAASQMRASRLMAAGKTEAAGNVMKDASAQTLVKIQLQTAQRNEALGKTAAALAAGDLDSVKTFYNEFVPDGAKVTDITRGANGALTISRQSDDGRQLPSQTMKDTGQMLAAMSSFKDPMALYNWSQNEFKNNLAVHAEARADHADARAAHADARSAAMASVTLAEHAEKSGDKTAKAAAGVALYKEKHPDATDVQLEAVRRGVLNAVPLEDKNAPASVKLAQALQRAGLAKNEGEALKMALQTGNKSPDGVKADIYGKALAANMGNGERAQKATEAAMSYLYPPTAAAPKAGGMGADPKALAIRDNKSMSMEDKRKALKDLGY